MATNLLPLRPTVVMACAGSSHRKPDASGRKAGGNSNWWAPVFGFPAEPDYIGANSNRKVANKTDPDLDAKPAISRFAPGAFTEDKARQLRKLTTESSSFHDVMYHSAIASRLASDFSDRSVSKN
ncbi:uncharacterized protein LOC116012828 [Ipomoea triloba]|uniref:uncharacterized protein LOC116012828 n=1 Tax=Ipomoea triloba TaxID=35885 RepID=UPI00125DD816|nr:uncharacterized protein LOC116012828 [Ipomoea triloba]